MLLSRYTKQPRYMRARLTQSPKPRARPPPIRVADNPLPKPIATLRLPWTSPLR